MRLSLVLFIFFAFTACSSLTRQEREALGDMITERNMAKIETHFEPALAACLVMAETGSPQTSTLVRHGFRQQAIIMNRTFFFRDDLTASWFNNASQCSVHWEKAGTSLPLGLSIQRLMRANGYSEVGQSGNSTTIYRNGEQVISVSEGYLFGRDASVTFVPGAS